MADPTPLGFLPINVAFERYVDGFGTNWDDDSAYFRAALRDGEITAITRVPGDPEQKVVPPTSWRRYEHDGSGGVHFSERVFSSPEIVLTAEGEWTALRGRTVFVEEAAFDRWLYALVEKYDPNAEAMWTLPMAVAWLVEGTKGAVRAQWPGYLSRTGRRSTPGLLKEGYVTGARQVMALWQRGIALPIMTRRDGTRSRLTQDEAATIALTLDDKAYPRFELAHPSGDPTRFTMQLLFTDAVIEAADIYPRGVAWQSRPNPTRVALDRAAEWTPFVTAALWAANGGRDGEVEGNGLETGSGEVLDRAASDTIEIRGILNLFGDDDHGYPDTIPTTRFKRAVFTWLEEERRTLPRIAVALEPRGGKADDEANRDLRTDFYLPDTHDARWRDVEVRTSDLVKAFDEDGWISPFESTGGPGRTSSVEILLEKMRRRHAAGQMVRGNRADEFRWLETWVSNPDGMPQKRGWPKMAERSMERTLGAEYARLNTPPQK